MSASKTAILAAVLLASSLLTTSPTQALPCGSNFPPSTVQEVRDCVPPPPPPPSKCEAMPDDVETELRASGKIDDDCNLNPPTCQNTVPPSGPVSCDPDPGKTCREVLADAVTDPDPCNPPSCETVAGNTGAAKPEACTPPTCLEAGGDAGMDAEVMEAACDTIEPPICEEVGQYFTAMGHNDTLPGRDEDCLPTLCVDLEEPMACLPGCENLRDIVGGVGHLLLDAECLPRKPLCEEVAPYTPVQPDFWIDCVPWGLPPTCQEVVATANDLGEDYLPMPLSCGLPDDKPCHDGRALPKYELILGNGESTAQFYQGDMVDRLLGTPAPVYVSWRLVANTVSIGMDDWGFGVEVNDADNKRYGVIEEETMDCVPLGTFDQDFSYIIDAGAGGTAGSASCSITMSWSITAGVEIGTTTSASASTTFGGSLTCGGGVVWDSESLIRTRSA